MTVRPGLRACVSRAVFDGAFAYTVFLALTLSACGSTDDSSGKDASTDVYDPERDGISVSWKVGEFLAGQESMWFVERDDPFRPVQGATVCLIENVDIPCARTDENGVFVLKGVPMDQEVLLTFKKEGYQGVLVALLTGRGDVDFLTMKNVCEFPEHMPWLIRTELLEDLFPSNVDFEKGIVGIATADGPDNWLSAGVFDGSWKFVAGTAISIHPSKGNGPYYIDRYWKPVSAPDEVSGAAFFINLDPREYEIGFVWPTGYFCRIANALGGDFYRIWGLRTEAKDRVRVPVRAGFLSYAGMACNSTSIDTADAGVQGDARVPD